MNYFNILLDWIFEFILGNAYPSNKIENLPVEDASSLDSRKGIVCCDIEDATNIAVDDPIPSLPEYNSRFTWIIDNGHGKLQAGKRSPRFKLNGEMTQFFEYKFNRNVATHLMRMLDNANIDYVDLVPDVEHVGSFLEGRVQRINELKQDKLQILISIHSNAGPGNKHGWSEAHGIETWYDTDKERSIAAIFQKHLVSGLGLKNRKLKKNKQTKFYFFKMLEIPVIYTETGFFNNKKEVKFLSKETTPFDTALAHYKAICEIEGVEPFNS